MPRPWKVLEAVDTPEGVLELRQRDERDFLITLAGRVLMNSLANRSEVALGRFGCAPVAHKRKPRVLIGGLGMGYTLRAALDSLPPAAEVTVVELNPAVERWCRGPLAHLTDHALDDPRVRLILDDVCAFLGRARPGGYDALLLDLYEGSTQRPLLALSQHALAPDGLLGLWSEETDRPLERRLKQAGFQVELVRSGRGGRRHAVYLCRPGVPPGARAVRRRTKGE